MTLEITCFMAQSHAGHAFAARLSLAVQPKSLSSCCPMTLTVCEMLHSAALHVVAVMLLGEKWLRMRQI